MTRVLSLMAGAPRGGAEAFFERLVGAFARANVQQRVAIRTDAARAARLRTAGVSPVELPFGGPVDIFTPLAIARQMREFDPDVALAFMSRAAARLPPRILTGRRCVRVGRLGGYYDLKYYRGCDRLIANTRDICAWIVRQGWPTEKVDYLPNFVDAARATPVERTQFGTPSDAKLVLALGRLHKNKAFDVLLEAVARVPAAHLWIAGAGDLDAALKAQAARLGIDARVRFLGWRQDVAALLAACDVLACPSRHEPLGNVVIEGWAHGKPVVAAESAGPAALIRDGETGLLVPVDDAAALAQALDAVLADPARAGRLAQAGEAAYQAEYTEGAVLRRYLDYFESVKA
ncbi:MAG: glycosyltransferase [Alphaproteobacteria bacterium]|nr:glycosyltransferase [Alphaproteobacteria bacterium]